MATAQPSSDATWKLSPESRRTIADVHTVRVAYDKWLEKTGRTYDYDGDLNADIEAAFGPADPRDAIKTVVITQDTVNREVALNVKRVLGW